MMLLERMTRTATEMILLGIVVGLAIGLIFVLATRLRRE